MKLSVLDQAPIISGHSAAQGIQNTLKLARLESCELQAGAFGQRH